MLDHMRAAANTMVAKAFLGLLLLSFALWGIPQAFYGQGSDAIYQSGKSEATATDYQFVAQNQAMQIYLRTGKYVAPNQFPQMGIANEILRQLKGFVLLDEEARLMKTNTGRDGTLRVLGSQQIFHGMTGQFSKASFQQYIEQLGISQNTYLDQLTKTGTRNQIIESVRGNMAMPDVFYSALVLNNRELRNIDFIAVTPSLIGTIADPVQDVLAAWYETQKSNFRAPEYRKASYISLNAKQLATPTAITDDELKEAYQNEPSKYVIPEKRLLDELRFNTRKEADEAAQKLKSGMSFDELVASLNINPESIRKGPISRTDLSSLVAAEIFPLQEGAISPVINDLQGPVIIRVIKILPSMPAPFDTVSEQIRQKLSEEKARDALSALVKTIADEQLDGIPLDEIAQKHNLPITTVTVDAEGNNPEGQAVENIPNKQNLIGGIFAATIGVVSDPLTSDEGMQWYQTDDIINSRDRTLDEARPAVIAAWKIQEMDRLIVQKAESFNTELANGKSLAQIASENNLQVEQATDLSRSGAGLNLNKEALTAIFSGPTNSTGIAPSNDEQTKLVFKVTSTTEPASTSPDSLDPAIKQQLNSALGQDVLAQYLFAVELAHPIQANNAIIQSILNP
ncbi:peptidyl-prolyl cis-trans isomerase [Bartonella sp. HY329]|uniref:peptidyl-prolyl cis-trans isomerase n=1 Tax=unclassified Bartonella TaxID=2645622 RepID=UPI0021C9A57F|nr:MULTISPECIES: peptidyl-prolyl cis-trans isomerase [unclassified Bartonella]UXM93998.1 peptidyl-prolyl cis-trans isomerase [Bartonella sp. HY329]UXN08320.1 peptidyl-prolyl cis-trans isomerase [Bartonella sp. HY328]